MNRKIIGNYILGDMQVMYIQGENRKGNQSVGMICIPTLFRDNVVLNKEYDIEPLIQVKVLGDDYPFQYAQGRTLRNSQSTTQLEFVKHEISGNNPMTITTTFRDFRNIFYQHIIRYQKKKTFECYTEIQNKSDKIISLELLSSFTLGGITPFTEGIGKERLKLHQIRSTWSNEGRLVTTPIEELQLEPSWKPSGTNSIHYGQVGSMPNREYFPFVGVEDTVSNVCWVVQLDAKASWQIEVYRKDNALCISGGIADREKGHWIRKINPGEKYRSEKAYITVGVGDIDAISQRIITSFSTPKKNEIPIVFNEFCTTWGNPKAEEIKKMIDVLDGKGIDIFVIDSGWYKKSILDENSWSTEHGEWNYNKELFPNGISEVVNYVHEHNIKAGIWFEWESCGRKSDIFNREERLYSRDGFALTAGNRRFLDLRQQENQKYVYDKVMNFVIDNHFDYLKIDYNANMGIGIDGPSSLGENLEEAMSLTIQKIKQWKVNYPDLLIENCAAGGHRISTPYVLNTDFTSFSDAHESYNIPIVAANMHRMLHPSQSSVLAVLHKEQSLRSMYYKISSTFLGTMCISGEILDLVPEQWDCIEKGISFYKKIVSIIQMGISQIDSRIGFSYKESSGYQMVRRKYKNKTLITIHTFENITNQIEIPIVGKCVSIYADPNIEVIEKDNKIVISKLCDFDGVGLLIEDSIGL